jgi:hypothetical protein
MAVIGFIPLLHEPRPFHFQMRRENGKKRRRQSFLAYIDLTQKNRTF